MHLPDATTGLCEFARVTRPGGWLVLFHPFGRAALAARHGRTLHPEEPLAEAPLRCAAEQAGWHLTTYDDPPTGSSRSPPGPDPQRYSRPPDAHLGRLDQRVVTVGRQLDPASFGRQPAHIHVASYLPQADILPYCDAIVSHGGTGTVLAGLARALPQVTIPIGADPPANARRCQELGIGPWLNPLEASPDAIAAAVQCVLTDPVHKRAAQLVHDEIATLPDGAQAVRMLERLTRG